MSSFYEGHSIQSITIPVRLMKRLGVETIIGEEACKSVSVNIDRSSKLPVTNAAGGLNEDYAVGDLMVLNDVRLNHLPYTPI